VVHPIGLLEKVTATHVLSLTSLTT
jgi:hypothetical protein